MALPNVPETETVQYQIYMDAIQALEALQSLKTNASSLDGVINTSASAIEKFAQKSGLSLKATENLFKNVLARAEQLRDLMASPKMGAEMTSIIQGAPDLARLSNIESPFTYLGKNVGFGEINARIRDANKELVIAEKNAQKLALNLLKADDAAKKLASSAEKPAEVLGRTFTSQQFAPVLQQFQQLSKLNFSNVTQYGQNVSLLMNNIKNLSTQTGASIQTVGKYIQQNFQNVPKVALQDAIKNLNTEMKGGEQTAQRYVRSIDAVRIALGALVAMTVFRTIQFIEESMRKAIETAQDFETSLYRLTNVERILSQAGTEITFNELNDSIAKIKEQLPIFSETDITKQLSLIGIMTKDLGLSADEMEQLAVAIGVLNIRSADTEDLMTTTNKVLQSIVSKGPGVGQLGVKFSEAAVTAKAVELGYIKAGESLSDLEDAQRDFVVGQAKVAIAIQNVSGEVQTLGDYMDLNTAKIQQGESAWEDFLKKLGQLMLPLKVAFSQTFAAIFRSITQELNDHVIPAIVNFFAAIVTAETVLANVLQGNLRSLGEIGVVFDQLKEKFSSIFIPEKAFEGLDTATEDVQALGTAVEDLSKLKGFDDLVDDLGKLQNKLEDLNQDFAIDQARAWEDYQVEVQRLVEDYAIKRRRIIEDANDKIADANRKYHNNQIDDEARFQEQLRQLREKFLFNLEDALRERDARQVLRLQRQYQMDKTALQNEHALKQQEQAREHQEDLARIRQERDDRLAELAEEERIRLQREREDYELKKQREEEDHARDIEDLKQQINDRLMEFAKAIGEEYNLNEKGVTDLYNLLQKYYGPNGFFDGLYDYSAKSMVARAQQMLGQLNAIIQQSNAILQSQASRFAFNPLLKSGGISGSTGISTSGNLGTHTVGRQAQGGIYRANRPTSAVFGDAGDEIAAFLPVNKLKAGTGSGSLSGLGGLSGGVQIDLLLSPDLEARVVRNTLSETAKVVAKVRRSKD